MRLRSIFRWPRRRPACFTVLSTLVLALTLALPSEARRAEFDSVTYLSFTPSRTNVIPVNTRVELWFIYNVVQPGGARIFLRPMAGASPAPNHVADSSELLTGNGWGSAGFTITAGNVRVTGIRIETWDANQITLLRSRVVPVTYFFTDAKRRIGSLILTPTPNILSDGQRVSARFTVHGAPAGGARVFVRPRTSGSPTPGARSHFSPLYSSGSSKGTGWFTISSGNHIVDQVVVTMTNASRSTVLFRRAFPVHYRFTNAADVVRGLRISPLPNNVLRVGDGATVQFRYRLRTASGARIFAQPMTGSSLTPGYVTGGSNVTYDQGSGPGLDYVTLVQANRVTGIRIQMWNLSRTRLLFSRVVPVDMRWE